MSYFASFEPPLPVRVNLISSQAHSNRGVTQNSPMGNAREVERIHQPLYRHHVLGRVAFRGQVICGQGQRDADHWSGKE